MSCFVVIVSCLCMVAANCQLAFLPRNVSLGNSCTGRGGCACDCSWAKSSACQHDDGSCCFACCCHGPGPAPSPPSPGPANVVGIFYEAGQWKCLDLPGGDTSNGNKLQIWDCNGMNNQKWVFTPGSWRIAYAGDTSKCIDVPGGDLSNGNALEIWDCNGLDQQVWGYDSNMHTIYLAKSASDASKCMDLKGGGTSNGNAIEIWDCNQQKNQQWVFQGPAPGPSPPSPGGGAKYCPNPSQDFNIDYGSPQLTSNGWHIQGGARVSSKATFNFAGGFLEFDMDLSKAHGNVNNNFYATFPRSHAYCDSGGGCTSCCAEMDFTENNGHCFQATTWHSDRSGHDHDGKAETGSIGPQVHVKAAWSADGKSLGVDVGGQHHSGEGFADVMANPGATLYSSQWTGWVPGNCGGDGNLGASSFSVSNLKIQATVVQGTEPTKC